MMRRVFGLVALFATIAGLAAVAERSFDKPFPHDKHARLFPGSCATCHAGAKNPAQSFWPAPASCASCHDGTIEEVVTWAPRSQAPASNVRFVHVDHARAVADSVQCAQCHLLADPRGEVHVSRAVQCVSCHAPGRGHLEVGDLDCATCHYPLAQARRLTPAAVAAFPVPLSHQVPGFGLEGHGKLAMLRTPAGERIVNTSCATCHAQNFCLNCHVNAPEVPAIQALALDERSLLHRASFVAPPSHAAPGFAAGHRRDAERNTASCATCHTRASCTACHVGQVPKSVAAMPLPAPTRAVGAVITRALPASHTGAFREGHASEASASPRTCATCHAREDCLACHRPAAARAPGKNGYHPATFLTRHPAAAYARQAACADCHNTQQFCGSCHKQAGLGGGNTLTGAVYHDGKAAFLVGHGQAARQSLESCASCHAERDCTACHAAQGGRRFSPHGPGFDGERLRRRNPEMCIACHGRAVPSSLH